MNTKKSYLASLILIDLLIVVFFVVLFTLPWIITWFVEVRNKDAGLPSLVMLVCYPCAPFAATTLFSLRKLVKNLIVGMVFGDKNIKMLLFAAISALCIALITFFAGRYYLPFYVIGFCAGACALIFKVVMDIFSAELSKRREELYESVKDEL